MRFLIAFLLLAGSVRAQGTFVIYDEQMNNITGGFLYVSDTNSTQMLDTLTVWNIDSVSHNVRAGRVIMSAPAGATNAMICGMGQYGPSVNTTAAESMPAGTSLEFLGYYWPNGNAGSATINYCFWETTDTSNCSCVTVVYTNNVTGVGGPPINIPTVVVAPNPAAEGIGFGWSHVVVTTVEIYSSTGELVAIRHVDQGEEADFNLTNWAPGLYFYNIYGEEGVTMTGTFIHYIDR